MNQINVVASPGHPLSYALCDERLRTLERECDALISLLRPHSAEESQRLYERFVKLAEAHAPRPCRGPQGDVAGR